jgi:hypothetical protein
MGFASLYPTYAPQISTSRSPSLNGLSIDFPR